MWLEAWTASQFAAVSDSDAIDENEHMFAQRGLVIEHVASHARVQVERRIENGAHSLSGNIERRHGNMPLQCATECDVRHARPQCKAA